MSNKQLYINDLINRFPSHTFTETIVDDHTLVEFKDGSLVTIAESTTLVDFDAYRNIRHQVLDVHDSPFWSTTTERDALIGIEISQPIYNITTDQVNVYDGSSWNIVGPDGGGTLQDAYDSGQSITTTTALGPVTLDNTGSTQATLELVPGTVPTTGLTSGQIYSDGSDLYVYDSVRGKFLSNSESIGFGLNGAADNEYMRVAHASDPNAAWVIPYAATITHITAFITAGQADKGFEIQDVSGTVLALFNLVASEFDGTQNVDIPAGTHLRAFIVATGGTVSNSVVSVFIRRRV